VTNFIASYHSRQEFPPLIGKLSDKATVEPLHSKNNAVQHLHVMFLKQVLSISSPCVYEKYGVDLGINTMQGREAKHVQIAAYAKNSLYKQRWFQVFRHDYISKVWLPSHQPSLFTYHQKAASLIPPCVLNDKPHYCYCGFEKETTQKQCCFCSHDLMVEIKQSVLQGKPTNQCLKYMSK
jgi:hypothetical protein